MNNFCNVRCLHIFIPTCLYCTDILINVSRTWNSFLKTRNSSEHLQSTLIFVFLGNYMYKCLVLLFVVKNNGAFLQNLIIIHVKDSQYVLVYIWNTNITEMFKSPWIVDHRWQWGRAHWIVSCLFHPCSHSHNHGV